MTTRHAMLRLLAIRRCTVSQLRQLLGDDVLQALDDATERGEIGVREERSHGWVVPVLGLMPAGHRAARECRCEPVPAWLERAERKAAWAAPEIRL